VFFGLIHFSERVGFIRDSPKFFRGKEFDLKKEGQNFFISAIKSLKSLIPCLSEFIRKKVRRNQDKF
jgi:hypothetical protein